MITKVRIMLEILLLRESKLLVFSFYSIIQVCFRYDIILDCAKFGYQNVPPSWKYNKFVTLNSPLMSNTDKYGVLAGLAVSARDLLLPRVTTGKNVRWGFFVPSGDGLKFIDDLVKSEKVIKVLRFLCVFFQCLFFR